MAFSLIISSLCKKKHKKQKVKRKETLYSLSKKYNVTQDEIKTYFKLSNNTIEEISKTNTV